MRRAPALLVCLAGVAALAAERPRAELVYVTEPSAESCPVRAELVDAVAARLGFDPFVTRAPQQVKVTLSRTGSLVRGRLLLEGATQGERTLESSTGDCRQVVDALAVAISIGLEPTPDPPPAPVPSPPPSEVQAAPEPEAPRHFEVRVGVRGLLGELPAASMGLSVAAEWRGRAVSLGAEGTVALPATVRVLGGAIGGGRISAWVGHAALVPCVHVWRAFGCAVATVGAMGAEGFEVPSPKRESLLHATLGGRVGLEWPVTEVLVARLELDLATPLTRYQFQLEGETVWRSSPVLGRAGLSLGGRF